MIRTAPVAGPTHVDVTEGGKKLRRGARLWTIAVATFKSETYRFLRLSAPTDEEIAAGAKFPVGYKPDVLLMSRRSRMQLQMSRTATTPTGSPAPYPQEAFGVPIQETDSILDTEALTL